MDYDDLESLIIESIRELLRRKRRPNRSSIIHKVRTLALELGDDNDFIGIAEDIILKKLAKLTKQNKLMKVLYRGKYSYKIIDTIMEESTDKPDVEAIYRVVENSSANDGVSIGSISENIDTKLDLVALENLLSQEVSAGNLRILANGYYVLGRRAKRKYCQLEEASEKSESQVGSKGKERTFAEVIDAEISPNVRKIAGDEEMESEPPEIKAKMGNVLENDRSETENESFEIKSKMLETSEYVGKEKIEIHTPEIKSGASENEGKEKIEIHTPEIKSEASENEGKITESALPEISKVTTSQTPKAEESTACHLSESNKTTTNNGDVLACRTCSSKNFGDTDALLSCYKSHPWQCTDCKSCSVCKEADNTEEIVFCGTCDKGYHISCHDPKIIKSPSDIWCCHSCEKIDNLSTARWNIQRVVEFISSIGFPKESKMFEYQEINGTSLLLLERQDVVNGLSLKMGPALKIYKHILELQTNCLKDV